MLVGPVSCRHRRTGCRANPASPTYKGSAKTAEDYIRESILTQLNTSSPARRTPRAGSR